MENNFVEQESHYMNILITGSAGFIGMNLTKYLLQRGETVIGIDNLSNYYDINLKKARNAILQKYENFQFYLCDISDASQLQEVFAKENIDIVVHLAAQAGVRYSIENPHAYISTNITGFLNLLECCRKHSIAKVIYASTSNVYGTNRDFPCREDAILRTPSSMYGVSKICSELMAHSYYHLYNMQMIGLRFFSVYGPWGRPDMALFIFTENILRNKQINVYNNGDMWRDFTYIDDIVLGIVAVIDRDDLEKYEIFNLGNHKCESLLEMITVLEKALGKTAQKNFMPMQPGDFQKSYASIDRAQKKLGFSPTTCIQEGIPQFVEWYLDFYKESL